MATNIYGTQYDDVIVLNDTEGGAQSNTPVNGSIKGRKLAKKTFDADSFTNAVYTGDGNDKVVGSTLHDAVDGGNGGDLILGGAGNDLLVGGNGKDTVYGGSGDDKLGSVAPTADATSDNGGDLLIGDGIDPEVVSGQTSANSTVNVTTFGKDEIHGGNGADTIFGDNEDASETAGGNDDLIYGGNGADTIYGGGGNDLIEGESGGDYIRAGAGDDDIVGGAGADQMWGGLDADFFVYEAQTDSTSTEYDTIHDFHEIDSTPDVSQQDKIDLTAFLGDDGDSTTHDDDLVWNGTSGSAERGVWYETGGGYTLIHADTDGNGIDDLTIRLVGEKELQAGDFKGVFGGDTTPPDAPVLTGIADDTGSSATDEITKDATLVISGTAEAGSSVEVFSNDVSIGTATADGSGNWSFDYTGTTLADDSYNFSAKATDAAGNTSAESADLTVVVDTTAPLAPVVASISEDTGSSATDEITKDATLVISGTAEAGSSVEVFSNDVSIGTATADGSGNWSFDYTGTTLADGSYNFSAKATDAAGNTSAESADLTVVVDTTAPTDLDITFVGDPGVVTTGGPFTIGRFVGADNTTINPNFIFDITSVQTAPLTSTTFTSLSSHPFSVDLNDQLITSALTEDTNYAITVDVRDLAGNIRTEVINIVVGNSGINNATDPVTRCCQ